MHACLAVTCHLQFWQNDQDLLGITVVKGGGELGVGGGGGGGTEGWNGCGNESAQKVDPGKENPRAVSTRTRTRDLSTTSPSLYH